MGLTAEIGKERRIAPAIDEAVKLAKYPNVSIKLSSAPNFSQEAYPFRDMTEHLKRCFDAFGPRRCYWGTDLTNSLAKATYRQRIEHFTEELRFLSEEDKDWVMGKAILARLELGVALATAPLAERSHACRLRHPAAAVVEALQHRTVGAFVVGAAGDRFGQHALQFHEVPHLCSHILQMALGDDFDVHAAPWEVAEREQGADVLQREAEFPRTLDEGEGAAALGSKCPVSAVASVADAAAARSVRNSGWFRCSRPCGATVRRWSNKHLQFGFRSYEFLRNSLLL